MRIQNQTFAVFGAAKNTRSRFGEGAQAHAILMNIIQTCRRQGMNIMDSGMSLLAAQNTVRPASSIPPTWPFPLGFPYQVADSMLIDLYSYPLS